MKKPIRILVPLAAISLLATLGYRQFTQRALGDPNWVRVSGNIEVTDAELGFKLPGRVAARHVSEGQTVRAGQVIAQLEQADLVQEVGLRKAEAGVAEALLAELLAGSRPEEIAQAEAASEWAAAEAARARLEYERQKGLHDKAIATTREFELAEAALKTSQAKLRETQERLALLRKGPREEQIAQARARVEQAQQARGLAETRLSYATLSSPLAGRVQSHHIEAGEYVAPGTPIVTVGNLEHPWLRAYIHETDLGRVKVGDPVEVTTDTYQGRRYPGKVSFIASQAEFTPKNVQTRKERVKLVYRIKIDLANPNDELKPGMPADAVIRLGNPAATAGK